MSQFIITDLDFIETKSTSVMGSGITPPISTGVKTATGTRTVTGLSISGDVTNGFDISAIALGQAAAAAAAAVSIGGKVTTIVIVRPSP